VPPLRLRLVQRKGDLAKQRDARRESNLAWCTMIGTPDSVIEAQEMFPGILRIAQIIEAPTRAQAHEVSTGWVPIFEVDDADIGVRATQA